MNDNINILLVEDDRIDQMAFERLIKKNKLPYQYSIADSANQAIELIKTDNYNVIITDYNLGDGTGSDILNHVSNTPVIFTTGAGDEEIAVKAMRSGAYDYLIKDPDRNYLMVLPVTIERAINDQKSAERLRLLESVVVNGNDAVLITNNPNIEQYYPRILYTNQAFSDVTGYSSDELIGQTIDILMGEKTSRRELARIRRASLHTKPVRTELICYKKNGAVFWNDINIVPVENESGIYTHWVSVHRDVTERKHTEEALIKARIMAEESMKSKERFLANMSHEIRTPMNAVIGMTNLLINNTSLTDEQSEYLEIIKESSDNLLVIINDILDFSKIESGKITFESTSFSLKNMIQNVVSILNVKAPHKGLYLNHNVDADCPDMLIGDSVRLNQILINLVGNAIKFTSDGGIDIDVSIEKQLEKMVILHFSVKDTGIGIDQSKFNTIFDSFSQAGEDTTRKFGGTGLGLAITKQLIELQGGKIWLQSQVNKGSKFSFTIPFELSEKEQEPKETKQKTIQKIDFSGRKILLVEDNYFNQVVAKKTLKSFGINCDVAENGFRALEKLQAHSYELILMDIQMPEMDGYEATAQIRSMTEPLSKIPIIAMTAGALKGDEEKCLEAGMDAYISKPFNPKHLASLLANYLPKNQEPSLYLQNERVEQTPGLSLEDELKQSGINLDYLVSLSGGSTEFIIEMIQLFLSQSPDYLDKMNYQLKQRKWADLSKTAHKFLSSVGYMGLTREAEMLREVETSSKAVENLDTLPGLVAEVTDSIHNLQEKLKRVFLSHKIAV